jgi:F-type H+-transporting ATPase subunit epsilon
MDATSMNLKILLPFRIYAEIKNVKRIVLETSEGSYGLLPHRLDCIAALVPGILTYEAEGDGVHYVAVDEGLLVKYGLQVTASVRNAIGGVDLGKLRESVEKEFINLDEQEKNVRTVMARLESGFIYNLEKLRKE